MVRIEEDRVTATGSIAGGFVLIPVTTLMATWRACRAAPLGIADFRAWLACFEVRARRCLAQEGRAPAYSFAELAKLLGISEKRARASVNRLVVAGLLDWSGPAIAFPAPPTDLDSSLTDSIGRGRGAVAIPRRILRFLAAGARSALTATALGVLLRCLARRRGGFAGQGRVKASWIAHVFAIDISRVKLARAELVGLGWIHPQASDQWAMNRWGKSYGINLDWDRDRAAGRRSPPPGPADGPKSPPPCLDQEPFQERTKHQEPGPAGPTGFQPKGSGGEGKARSIPDTPKPVDSDRPAPTLADIRVGDLKDTGRLLDLLGQAVAGKLVGPSEADRLKFVAAAEHALAIGRGNPPGLFVHLVRGKLWRYLTQEDEGRANARIKASMRGPDPLRVVSAPVRSAISKDARMVREFRRSMAAAGYRGDPFPQVRRHDPSWTRDRWDAAVAELGSKSDPSPRETLDPNAPGRLRGRSVPGHSWDRPAPVEEPGRGHHPVQPGG